MSECKYRGCGRPVSAKSLCGGHYQQQWKGQELRPLQDFAHYRTPEEIPECLFSTCARAAKSKGLCDAHYRQQRRGAPLTEVGSTSKAAVKGQCQVDGCDSVEYFTRLCRRHYSHKQQGKDLVPFEPKMKDRECCYTGCDKKCRAADLCSAHYAQLLRGEDLRPLTLNKVEERECRECGKIFLPGRNTSFLCSNKCQGLYRLHPLSKAHRDKDYEKVLSLLPEYVVEDEVSECWIWQGKLTASGYPSLSNFVAHRVVLEAKLRNPLGLDQAHHMCAVRDCVNPDHLQAVSERENVAEMNQRNFYLRRIAELERQVKELSDPRVAEGVFFALTV